MAARIKKPKVQRIKFSREDLYNDYFEDMKCLACISTLQPFQFAHTLNILLDRNFRLQMELMQSEAGDNYKVFNDTDKMRGIEYHIICNRHSTEFLIPELPNSDFLLLMNGMSLHYHLYQETLSQLSTHGKISYSYSFNPMQIKSKEYLIL